MVVRACGPCYSAVRGGKIPSGYSELWSLHCTPVLATEPRLCLRKKNVQKKKKKKKKKPKNKNPEMSFSYLIIPKETAVFSKSVKGITDKILSVHCFSFSNIDSILSTSSLVSRLPSSRFKGVSSRLAVCLCCTLEKSRHETSDHHRAPCSPN